MASMLKLYVCHWNRPSLQPLPSGALPRHTKAPPNLFPAATMKKPSTCSPHTISPHSSPTTLTRPPSRTSKPSSYLEWQVSNAWGPGPIYNYRGPQRTFVYVGHFYNTVFEIKTEKYSNSALLPSKIIMHPFHVNINDKLLWENIFPQTKKNG